MAYGGREIMKQENQIRKTNSSQSHTDLNGRVIEELMEDTNCICMNDGTYENKCKKGQGISIIFNLSIQLFSWC